MSDHLDDLRSTVDAILTRHAGRDARTGAKDTGFLAPAWAVLEGSGMTTIGADDEVGLAELAVLARSVGRAAAPLPLVESACLAAPLLATAGIDIPDGVVTVALHPDDRILLERRGDGWHVTADLARVPWGRHASAVAATADLDGVEHAVLLPGGAVLPGTNLAGEPRDGLRIDVALPDGAVAPAGLGRDTLRLHGAVLRAASMVGAMEGARDLTLAHATTRVQFGRPISAFQAVQHHLVAVASEVLCSTMAVDLAVAAEQDQLAFAAAAAKATAGRSAGVVSRSAHQVHAAIGVTDEHALPWFTTRLWSWRDEFGSTADWARALGAGALAAEPAELWRTITRTVGGRSLAEVGS